MAVLEEWAWLVVVGSIVGIWFRLGNRFVDKTAGGETKKLSNWQNFSKAATHGLDVDIHDVVKTDEKIGNMHEAAEVFEPRVEYSSSYLQDFSPICVIFAHGAGEVGYMAGHLATIWDVYQKGQLSKSVTPPVWTVLIGAIGLVIGLATYGYNVTRSS